MKLYGGPLASWSMVGVAGIASLAALVLGAGAVSGGTLDALGRAGLSKLSRTLPEALLEPTIPPANLQAPPDAARGGRLMLNTDGVTDAINGQQEPFSIQRLNGLMASYAGLPPTSAQALCRAVFEAVTVYEEGTAQFDDFTLVIVERSPNPKV